MQIAIGTVIYFAFELALGIVTGKLLRHRRREKPAAIFAGRPSPGATCLGVLLVAQHAHGTNEG